MRRRILLVTADTALCDTVKAELSEKFSLSIAKGITEALSAIESTPPHLLLLDLVLQDSTSLELMEQVRTLGVANDLPASTDDEKLPINLVRDQGGLLPAILLIRDQWKNADVISGLLETAEKLGVAEMCSLPRELGKLQKIAELLVGGRRFTPLEEIKLVSFAMRGKRLRASLSRHAGNFTRVAEDFCVTRSAPYNWADQHSMRTDVSSLRVDLVTDPTLNGAVLPHNLKRTRSKNGDYMEVLVAEDLEHKRAEIALRFKESKCDLTFANDGVDALQMFESGRFLCVLTDLAMPRMDGLELIEQIRRMDRTIPIVLLSGFANVATTVAAMNRGAQHVYRYEDQDLSDIVSHVEQLASTHASVILGPV